MVFMKNNKISAASFLNRYYFCTILLIMNLPCMGILTQKRRLPIGLWKSNKQTPFFSLKIFCCFVPFEGGVIRVRLYKQTETGVRITVEWSNPCFGSFFSRVNFGA